MLKWLPSKITDHLCDASWCSIMIGVLWESVGPRPDALSEWVIGIFGVVDTRVSFCCRGAHLLPPRPGSSFCHHEPGIKDFHMKYVLVPAGGVASSVVGEWRLCCVGALRHVLIDTSACRLRASLGGVCCRWALLSCICILVSMLKRTNTLISWLVSDACLWLGPPWLNLRFTLALTICES